MDANVLIKIGFKITVQNAALRWLLQPTNKHGTDFLAPLVPPVTLFNVQVLFTNVFGGLFQGLYLVCIVAANHAYAVSSVLVLLGIAAKASAFSLGHDFHPVFAYLQ